MQSSTVPVGDLFPPALRYVASCPDSGNPLTYAAVDGRSGSIVTMQSSLQRSDTVTAIAAKPSFVIIVARGPARRRDNNEKWERSVASPDRRLCVRQPTLVLNNTDRQNPVTYVTPLTALLNAHNAVASVHDTNST